MHALQTVRTLPVRAAARLRTLQDGDREAGMTTAEYAVGTVAACGFSGILYKVITSPEILGLISERARQGLQAVLLTDLPARSGAAALRGRTGRARREESRAPSPARQPRQRDRRDRRPAARPARRPGRRRRGAALRRRPAACVDAARAAARAAARGDSAAVVRATRPSASPPTGRTSGDRPARLRRGRRPRERPALRPRAEQAAGGRPVAAGPSPARGLPGASPPGRRRSGPVGGGLRHPARHPVGDEGVATVLVLCCAGVLVLVAMVYAALAAVGVARQRAASAADLSALGAAQSALAGEAVACARGRRPGGPRRRPAASRAGSRATRPWSSPRSGRRVRSAASAPPPLGRGPGPGAP